MENKFVKEDSSNKSSYVENFAKVVEEDSPITWSYVENFAVVVEEAYPMISFHVENSPDETYPITSSYMEDFAVAIKKTNPITSSYAENVRVAVEETSQMTSSYEENLPVAVEETYPMTSLYAQNFPVAVEETYPLTLSYAENFPVAVGQTYPIASLYVENFTNEAYPMKSSFAENFPVAVEDYSMTSAYVENFPLDIEELYPMTSLYVGNLHPNVTEDDLYKKFSPVGSIDTIFVCRDAVTLDSLRYAYVNFLQQSYAEIAINTLNYDYLEGLPMRIMWSCRDPSLRRSGLANVFIKNLHKSIDNNLLLDTFSAFGNILSCKVEMDNSNKSKGYGFVQFETKESAKIAIEQINGKDLNGKKVYVGPFIPAHKRNQNEKKEVYFTNLFVKNLGEETSEQQLREIFEKIGTVISVKIKMNHDGKSQGCGFVTFDNMESAKKAIAELHGKEIIAEKTLYVSRAQVKAERKQNHQERIERFQRCNVLIRHLDSSVSDVSVREKFQQFGTITSTKVVLDENGRSRCYGFVRFSSPEEASEAVRTMDNRVVWSKPLSVTIAKSKENWLKYKHSQQLQRSAFIRNQVSQAVATECFQQYSRAPRDLNEGMSTSHRPIQLSQTAVNSEAPANFITASRNPKRSNKNKINQNSQLQRRLTLSEFIVPKENNITNSRGH